jgi:toxin ParE1/3/4
MRVILGPGVRTELREATDWYAGQSPDVARRFLADYRRTKALVAEAPQRWPEVEPGVRRVLFDKFPYALLYVVEERRVVVLVLKHHKRHPDYWKNRRR